MFEFEENTYFKNAVLKKSFVLQKSHEVDTSVGTVIEWNEGCDVTVKKVKKKKKGKNVTKLQK